MPINEEGDIFLIGVNNLGIAEECIMCRARAEDLLDVETDTRPSVPNHGNDELDSYALGGGDHGIRVCGEGCNVGGVGRSRPILKRRSFQPADVIRPSEDAEDFHAYGVHLAEHGINIATSELAEPVGVRAHEIEGFAIEDEPSA